MALDDEGSAWPDLVRKFCRLVTCDQSQLVSESPLVVVPIVLTGRCSFFEASSARSLESTLSARHEVIRVSAPRSSMVSTRSGSSGNVIASSSTRVSVTPGASISDSQGIWDMAA